MRWTLVPAALCLAAAAGCSDARCSLANCRKMYDPCQIAFAAEPDARACRDVDGGVPTEFDFVRYCPAACNAMANGELAQCVADNATACGDGGVARASVVNACFYGSASRDAVCGANCDSDRASCQHQCTQDSFQACMDCAAGCGVAWGTCNQRCR